MNLIQRIRHRFQKREEPNLFHPQPWFADLFGRSSTFSGERVTSSTALLNSNVYACASILGGDVGKLPLQVFRRTATGVDRESNHPVAQLIGQRPNPYMSAYTFKELMQVHLVCWGNAYAYIEWDQRGYPQALWVLDPTVTDVRVDTGTGQVWVITTIQGEQRKLPWHDVLHLKLLSQSGLKGITPISVIREKIGIQQASEKFLGSFYAHGTATRGVLKVPTLLNNESKQVVREEWRRLNSGLTNAQKIAILDGGLEYQSMGMPLADAQFIETQKFGILEIAKIYKIPPHKLGQLDRATFSNIEHQSLEYVKNTLQPILTNWEQEVNYKLFTERERKRYYVKFNVTSELRGDSQSRAQYYKEMIGMGVYTINEVRELEERDNIGELGDKHLVSLNYTTLNRLEEYQTDKVNMKKGGDPDEEGDSLSTFDRS